MVIKCKICWIDKYTKSTSNHKVGCKCVFCCKLMQANNMTTYCNKHTTKLPDLDLDFYINSDIDSVSELYGDTFVDSDESIMYNTNLNILLENSDGLYGDSKYICNLDNNNNIRFYGDIDINLTKMGNDISIGYNLNKININNDNKKFIYDNVKSSLILGQYDINTNNIGHNSATIGINNMANGIASLSIGVNHDGELCSTGMASATIGYSNNGILKSTGTGSLAMGLSKGGEILANGNASVAIGVSNNKKIITNGMASISCGVGEIVTNGIGSMSIGNDLKSDVNYSLIVGNGCNNLKSNNGIYLCGGDVGASMNIDIFGNTPIGSISCDHIMLSSSGLVEYYEKNMSENIEIGHFVSIYDGLLVKNDKTLIGITCAKMGIMFNSSPLYWHNANLVNDFNEITYDNINKYDEILLKYGIDDLKNIELHPMKDVIENEIKNIKQDKYVVNNKNYDNSMKYIPRSERDSWIPVCIYGKVNVIDNGKCIVNQYCDCKNNIAVPGDKWLVMSRINDNVITIFYK